MADNKPATIAKTYCIGCGRLLNNSEFYSNYNKIHLKYNNGKMHYCKNCCKDIAQELLAEYWANRNYDDIYAYKLGIRNIDCYFDLPYIDDIAEQMYINQTNVTRDKNINLVYQYQKIFDELGYSKELYDNLVGNSLLVYNLLPNTKDNNNAKLTQSGDLELVNELEYTWGTQDGIDDYIFLEERFHLYTDGEDLTPAIQNMIKYLVLAELDVKKLRKAKAEQKEITQAEKRVNDYYAKLSFDKVKFNQNKEEIEQFIENWSFVMENKEPLDWVDEHLEDINGFKADNDEIMRALGNKILGTKDYPSLTSEDVKKKKVKKRDTKAKTGKT